MLIGIAFLLGILGSVVNHHYIIKEATAPSYFLPGLVGLAVQVSKVSCQYVGIK
ncbi:unnamed protein product [Angiostrongylus costaricensis]|uniref:Sulfate_transp domain-containing protein n=1 Tax=Angiostrongylus costaricensis TaxID=334426 RepID=A0A0R3PUQ1_ANGCS|nr:unnamed protein product [Angiostrongylus costaricensis]